MYGAATRPREHNAVPRTPSMQCRWLRPIDHQAINRWSPNGVYFELTSYQNARSDLKYPSNLPALFCVTPACTVRLRPPSIFSAEIMDAMKKWRRRHELRCGLRRAHPRPRPWHMARQAAGFFENALFVPSWSMRFSLWWFLTDFAKNHSGQLTPTKEPSSTTIYIEVGIVWDMYGASPLNLDLASLRHSMHMDILLCFSWIISACIDVSIILFLYHKIFVQSKHDWNYGPCSPSCQDFIYRRPKIYPAIFCNLDSAKKDYDAVTLKWNGKSWLLVLVWPAD